jgi:hypothetical protein
MPHLPESSNDRNLGAPTDSRGDTLFMPAAGDASSAGSESLGISLPPDLQAQVVRRLRLVTLAYAAAYFFADFFPTFLFGEFRDRLGYLEGWIFGAVSIVLAVVACLAFGARMAWGAKIVIGLIFQVVGSYGIAAGQYAGVTQIPITEHLLHVLSPSWVGVWMVFFSVVVPAPARWSLAALLASASAAPVVLWATMNGIGKASMLGTPVEFFFRHVFPYLICAALAYAGGQVLFKLGVAIKRARELGSYRLIERLGRGGMGEVWRATHRMLARPAAVKFIRPDALAGVRADRARLALRRFELEAQATASLTSPHTVALYDYGAADDGRFYYVMELLDGLDLEALVRRHGPQPPERVVHLVAQACESLEEAHEKGMVHRDIKPANIYACRSGSRHDFVKVLDFGLVASHAWREGETRLTQEDQATGTPAYMPPEVAAGKAIDGRADLYALGCVAYWLATGRQVFDGATVYDVVYQHMTIAPAPASGHAGANVPPALDALILRCLAKDPDDRPRDARELSRLLRAIPLDAEWDEDRARAWWIEHPVAREGADAANATA